MHGKCSVVLRLLDFLTGEDHPLAANPLLTIVTHVTFDRGLNAQAEVLGDTVLVLVNQGHRSSHEIQVWYLVEWKTGRVVSVSAQGLRLFSQLNGPNL
jgi:hypothetical protein